MEWGGWQNRKIQSSPLPVDKPRQTLCNATQEPNLSCWWPTSGKDITGMEAFPEKWRDQDPNQTPPTLGTCTRKMSPHIWHWKLSGLSSGSFENQWGLTLGEPEGYGKQSLFYKGQHTISLDLRPSTKAAVWKLHKVYKNEIYWLILAHVVEGQGSAGALFENSIAGGCHFSYSSLA